MDENTIIETLESLFPSIRFYDGGARFGLISLRAIYHNKVMSIQQSTYHYCDSESVEIAVWEEPNGDFIRLSDFTDDVCGYVEFDSLIGYAKEFFGA